tara:strand:- start:5163 stop:5489 length:327 start_codon:yes stop_codon:yes gene_type:complete
MELVLQQIGIGILAVLLYNVFKFQKMLNKKDLKTKVFWTSYWIEWKFKWLWNVLMLVLISSTIYMIPESAESIKNLTALDIGTQLVSFFTLGIGLSSLTDTTKPGGHV